MSTNSIGRWWQSATRRRLESDVRVHPDAGQVPSPVRHRAPARGAAPALTQIRSEAPVQQLGGYAYDPRTLAGIRHRIDQCHEDAEAMDRDAFDLLNRAEHRRREAADLEHLLWLADATQELRADGPQVPLDPGPRPALAGDRCYGCNRSRDTLPCYSALEGRDVPLCPRCHPSADEIDDSGADGEEPELAPWEQELLATAEPIDPAKERAQAEENARFARFRAANPDWEPPGGWDPEDDTEAEAALDAYVAAEPPYDEDLPEALTSGPAAVPQPQRRRDTQTITLPWGRPRVLDDTLTDLMTLDGVEQ